MDDPETLTLLRELVHRLLPSPVAPPNSDSALRYAQRLLSSRLSSSLLPDESAVVDSIKRELSSSGRLHDALSFSDLHAKLSALPSPPLNRWALLYLLKSLSSSSASSLPAGLVVPTLAPASISRKPPPTAAGALRISKDPDSLREIAMREYADLVMEDSEASEPALVRDVLYACQGIDGRFVRFDKASDGYDLPPSIRVTRATRVMVRKLCELGWLFRKVRGFVVENAGGGILHAADVGTVAQAFCSALQEELSDYYKLLAELESCSLHPIPMVGSELKGSGDGGGDYLSLRRLAVRLADKTARMRLMAVLVDRCRGLKGGAMAGAIHGLSRHGDPVVQEFMGGLLQSVCSPLFAMVRSWVLQGELKDLFGELFVVKIHVKDESLWRASLWREGYRIEPAMLPSFISSTLAQRIFRTGKSINFLRECCEDSGWQVAAPPHVGTTTGYGQTDALEALVIEAAKLVDQHLMDVIHTRYRFKDHCLAIKRYLLLGQGDFVQYLMDIVGPELSEPANTISHFQLAGLLESAIRASNAQYDDHDILDRLKVKMMDIKDGDRGWDVFSLEYDARVPLDTIFTASAMKIYLRIFNFLWKLKRGEHALIGFWRTVKPNCIISCAFSKEAAIRLPFVSVLRKCQVLWNEMSHFVTNFQYYIMFEVLEISWARFSEEMDSAKDLDDLLLAHDRYLNSIVEKSLLGERSQNLLNNLFELFDIILRFRSRADRWFEQIYELEMRGRGKSKTTSKLLASWIDGGKGIFESANELFKKMGENLDGIAKDYSVTLDAFISQLPLQQHVDLKFLLFRLDFTEYYSRLSSSR